jgi:hypothetical protein
VLDSPKRKDKNHGRQKGKIPGSQKECKAEIEGETETETETETKTKTKTDESCLCESEIEIDEETRRGQQKEPQNQNSRTSRLKRSCFLRAARIGRQVRRTVGRHARYFRSGADSESVEELLEEGQSFEAEVVAGVENAPEPDESEVRTKEVPEDDVPEEYRERD